MVRRDFPFVAIGHFEPSFPDHLRKSRLSVITEIETLCQDPEIDGLVITSPMADCAELVHRALSAGKRLLLEGSFCESAAEANALEQMASARNQHVGIFFLQREERDFRAARSAIASDRLGALHAVRWIDCEYSIPVCDREESIKPTWQGVLSQVGPWLFNQLGRLIEREPQTVQAWAQPQTAGFQARMGYADGLSVWLDVQRMSSCGLRTGWCLEGTTGAYRSGRLMSIASDGELREELIAPTEDGHNDVIADLHRLATSSEAAQRSLRQLRQSLSLQEAIVRSIALGEPVLMEPKQ